MTEFSLERKKNEKNKGTDMQYVAGFCCTIQLITIKLCTKFQNQSLVVAEKSLTEKMSIRIL